MDDNVDPRLYFSELIKDNVSGSKDLALKVSKFFQKYSYLETEQLNQFGEVLYSNFAGMGLVRNTILELQAAVISGKDIKKLSDEIRKRILKQARMATEKVASLFLERTKLVTISRSSQVEDAIVNSRNKIENVYVLESRPMLEGTSLYRRLIKLGIRATLLTDASMNIACRKADFALVGCDSILGDMSLVHKVGTFPLFSIMHYYSKKNYALGISMKEENQYNINNYPEFRNNECSELGIPDGNCINQYFELIPRHLLDGFYNENGSKILWK